MRPTTVLLLTATGLGVLVALSRSKGSFQKPPADVAAAIRVAAEKYSVPLELLTGVAWVESRYKQSAVSPKGAIGVMQLMPGTASSLGVDPHNMTQNVAGGAKYLRALYTKYGNWNNALAAYNWGSGNVDQGGMWPSSVAAYIRNVYGAARAV